MGVLKPLEFVAAVGAVELTEDDGHLVLFVDFVLDDGTILEADFPLSSIARRQSFAVLHNIVLPGERGGVPIDKLIGVHCKLVVSDGVIVGIQPIDPAD